MISFLKHIQEVFMTGFNPGYNYRDIIIIGMNDFWAIFIVISGSWNSVHGNLSNLTTNQLLLIVGSDAIIELKLN